MARFMLYAVALAVLFSGCKSEGGKIGSAISTETQIGDQIWMTENLKATTFRNGDPIMEATNFEQWNQAVKEEKAAFCYLHFDAKEGEVLYNTFAVMDARGLAPEGWHIPSEEEWEAMAAAVFQAHPEEPVGTQLKAKGAWEKVDGIPGTNKAGFNAYPVPLIIGGVKKFSDTYWKGVASVNWWCSHGGASAYLAHDKTDFSIAGEPSDLGISVRCVKD